MSCVKKTTNIDQNILNRISDLETQVKILTEKVSLLTKGKKRGPKPKLSSKVVDINYIEDDKVTVVTEGNKKYNIVLDIPSIDFILSALKQNMYYEMNNVKLVT